MSSLNRYLRRAGGLLGFVIALLPCAHATLEPGQPLPELARYNLTGDVPDLAGKVVLLDVWASWCAPCKASFPAFSALQQELGADGFVILGVSVDKRTALYEQFLAHQRPGFATVLDDHQQLVATLGPPAMPTSFLFGRDGRLRSVHTGFHGDRTIEELRAEIRPLLQEKTP